MIPSRRGFMFGAGALLAAPSIVRVASLMPVSVISPTHLVTAWPPDWFPSLVESLTSHYLEKFSDAVTRNNALVRS